MFDPNAPASANSGIFGLPYSTEEADLVLLPVPWDVTVSYGNGTAKGPEAILAASAQIDVFLRHVPQAWTRKISLLEISKSLKKKSKKTRKLAESYIDILTRTPGKRETTEAIFLLQEINSACDEMIRTVHQLAAENLTRGKLVGLVGGDHSTPMGYISALAELHDSFSILQIDAHCDLRAAYEDFTWSHASIMYNALTLKEIDKLVQVGIRDFCEEENDFIEKSKGRVKTFFDEDLKKRAFEGESWKKTATEIVKSLGEKVYISFDIDGLDPKLCPNTGTPVPGGLEFHQATYLMEQIVASGRVIIGFDVVEVTPGDDEWDANVGARLIWDLCHKTLDSQKNIKPEGKQKRAVKAKPKKPIKK